MATPRWWVPRERYGDVGAAEIFQFEGAAWQQTAELTEEGSMNDWLGSAVSLSSDGRTALVGADGRDANVGGADVFTVSNGSWALASQFGVYDPPGAGDAQGTAVALSGNGEMALVGAPRRNGGAVRRLYAAVVRRRPSDGPCVGAVRSDLLTEEAAR